MPDDVSFLRALHASPDDNIVRLVYADWLDENGEPDRAEFLRREVALHEREPNARTHELREPLHEARRGLDPRWLAAVDRPRPGWRVARPGPSKTYGRAIPGFIHNGSYYLTPINVYSDGAIDCWGYVDVPLFRDKLAQGWVVPRVEVGGLLVIHDLGSARVAAAEWDHTPGDFEQVATDALRELNPSLEGLIDMEGTDVDVRDGIRYAKGFDWGDATLYRVTPTGEEVAGRELPVLEVVAGGYRLRHWLIYADGLTQLDSANVLMPLDAVSRMFDEGRLTLSVPEGAWVTLDGLGRFQAGEGNWSIEAGERLREASDLIDQSKGRPGAIERCRDALAAYEAEPSEGRRERLRAAYEAVPEHLRLFCGDMDSKDGPIRRILGIFDDEDEDPE